MPKLLVGIVGVFTMLSMTVVASYSVQALSSNGPDSADYGNSSARYTLEDTTQLKVTRSIIPIYYSTNPGTVTVTANSFSFENSTRPHPYVSFNGRSGVQSDTTFPVSGFTYDPNTGYFVALITAEMTGVTQQTYNVINWKLSVPGGGIIGTYAANGSNSAVELPNRCDSLDNRGCGQYYNYSLPFGTQCQAQGNQVVSATIYDGDNGNIPVQTSKNFTVNIFDETDNKNIAFTLSGSESNGQTATYTFTVQPYHKYRFQVNNVYANNVMQINLPYDGITYLSDCRSLEKTDRIYGSWGEYGVMATGVIKGIGSGSAFAGRGLSYATTCSYTFLTLANATNSNCKSTPPANYGGYKTGRTIPNVAANFPVTSAAATLRGNNLDVSLLRGTYKTAGNITLTGGMLQKGKTVVINTYNPVTKAYGDITIAGNITYTTDPLTSADQIPQLVLIAGNINIRDTVTQVDGWLSAEGTLNTCSNINRTSITINNCNQLLTINGPVMAKEVQLWRTAGSLDGDNSGAPAEVFNLRPDAYLWGLSQSAQSGRLETVYTQELPPRF
ncbi:MAG: hypothetical protein EOT05_01680 [Candidatus Microsaccharimonas sossegonensis]|uniref:Uncharacterized protein n=1 Tax=Candidatus Microsaccharimonas sossegonensis TaxID=2506948 RepID=A0A4Q0AH09_9BACT|nr:MAG: hypothetical protein EOT05_01680 [Candidatus Microsaccharimonas sossegonensis]